MHPSLADSPVDGRWAVDGVRLSLGSGSVSKFSFFSQKHDNLFFNVLAIVMSANIWGQIGRHVVGKVLGGLCDA